MKIQQVSSGASAGHNEDLVAVFAHHGHTDIVVIDGASSVADGDYIDREAGDVVWFVRSFAKELQTLAGTAAGQEQAVVQALANLRERADWQRRAPTIPRHAWPIAALTWVRVTEGDDGATLDLYCLGDCKAFLLAPGAGAIDLDPYVNPQESILQDEIARLAAQGVTDAAARRQRLLPMLRARREEQNDAASPSALCLEPKGPFAARRYRAKAGPGTMLLVMTDGFSRIYDTYDLCSLDQLSRRCLDGDLEVLLHELRSFERASLGADSMTVKRSDDASAVICSL
jgi:serine/threonine protein phosphatase PrpC